jgi:transcriptional regulator with XRE-family HTH domain
MQGPIAVKLWLLREEQGLTQKEVAELANPSRSWWWRSSLPLLSVRGRCVLGHSL